MLVTIASPNAICGVCMDRFRKGDKGIQLMGARYTNVKYHVHCIEEVLEKAKNELRETK